MNEEMTRYEALIACRDKAGSDSQLARDFGVSQPRVWRWINQSKQLPPEYVLTAEHLYGIPRHFLRPDIYPVNLPPAPRWASADHSPLDDTTVIPAPAHHNGNRTHVLDAGAMRRAAL